MVKEAGTTSKSSYSSLRKRSRTTSASVESVCSLFNSFFNRPSTVHSSGYVFDLQVAGERDRLIDELWRGEWALSSSPIAAVNAEMCEFFEMQSLDSADSRKHRQLGNASRSRWEGVLTALTRWHNLHKAPIIVAALAIRFWHHDVPRVVWATVTTLFRVTLSQSWVQSFLPDAMKRDPGPRYPVAEGISAAAFDNFSIRAAGGLMVEDDPGEQINMTNWASLAIPRAALRSFDLFDKINQMVANGDSLFREDLAHDDFIDLFSPIHPELISFRAARLVYYLTKCANGKLDEKLSPHAHLPSTHMKLHEPIWDRSLQSSYDDVNAELQHIRTHTAHENSAVLFIGCDGLGYSRLIHRLSQDPTQFLETTPIVVPQLGEHPHGSFHVLHSGWRLWWPLIERFVLLLNNLQVRADPNVSAFNEHEHFLRILTAGFTQWLLAVVAAGGPGYSSVPPLMRACDANLSCACIIHFLHDFAFLFKSVRDGVRKNDSKTLDLCWRDFVASGRTNESNKTQYCQMAVSRVYWGCALREPLQTAYHQIRALKLKRTHVGWDMFIERVNLSIRQHFSHHVSREHLTEFLHSFVFTDAVDNSLSELLNRTGDSQKRSPKDIDAPVKAVVAFLNQTIEKTFSEASSSSDANLLGLNLSKWGGGRAGYMRRSSLPWEKTKAANTGQHDYRAFVADHCKLFPWHKWAG